VKFWPYLKIQYREMGNLWGGLIGVILGSLMNTIAKGHFEFFHFIVSLLLVEAILHLVIFLGWKNRSKAGDI